MDTLTMGFLFALALLAALLLQTAAAEAGCFVAVAGRRASATGRVALGHNEDNRGELVMRHHYIPPARGLGGRALSFEPGAAEIPQTDETLGFFWTETLRPAPGESFGDSFVNERGLAVVSNTCCQSREDAPDLTDGGVGWGLRLLVAQRASSAREAVDTAAGLVLKYGYRSSGRSYVFADSREAWVFQTVNGKHYAARRLPDDHVLVNPNHYSIHEMDLRDPEHFRASPGLIEHAVRRGWYEPASEDFRDFDFAAAYQHPDYVMVPLNEARHRFGLALAAGTEADPRERGGRMPFSLPPASPLSLPKIRRILSCHCGRPEERSWTGAGPHAGGGITETENVRGEYTRICNGATRESLLIDLRDDPRRTVVWSCFGNPCSLPMTPWHLGAARIPEAFRGGSSEEALAGHFRASRGELEAASGEAWRASRALVAYCDGDYASRSALLGPRLEAVRKEIEGAHADFEEGLDASPGPGALYRQAEAQAERAVRAMKNTD